VWCAGASTEEPGRGPQGLWLEPSKGAQDYGLFGFVRPLLGEPVDAVSCQVEVLNIPRALSISMDDFAPFNGLYEKVRPFLSFSMSSPALSSASYVGHTRRETDRANYRIVEWCSSSPPTSPLVRALLSRPCRRTSSSRSRQVLFRYFTSVFFRRSCSRRAN
jgi:hypothetical protein